MLIILSPSKTLDLKPQILVTEYTLPTFLKQSEQLINLLRKLSCTDIKTLMHVSDSIAKTNYDRYRNWNIPFTTDNAKQALLAFKGDVYTSLGAETFSPDDFNFAQNHIAILSGLYGVLNPLDLIQPYRLEMGIKLKNAKGGNLYTFWGNAISNAINKKIKESPNSVIINLASAEYFKAIDQKKLITSVITPEFREYKNGNYEMIGIFAKKARGKMTRFVIKNKITNPEDLKAFDESGYNFNPRLSKDTVWVFSRGN